LDINYLTLSPYDTLDPNDYCSSSTCTIKGGPIKRKQVLLNIILNKRICVKLVSLEDIFSRNLKDYTVVNSKSRCPEAYIQCGYLNPTSYLCASSTNLCPISSLKILPKDTLFTKKYYSIDLEHDWRLFYSFEEVGNYLITTDMRIGYEGVCLDSLEMKYDQSKGTIWQHWDLDFNNSCLSDFWNKETGDVSEKVYEDSRFKEIGKINWNLLYQENLVSKFLESEGHGTLDFSSSLDYDISIYSRYALRYNR
jgi:predicted transposase YbfD/YdcC